MMRIDGEGADVEDSDWDEVKRNLGEDYSDELMRKWNAYHQKQGRSTSFDPIQDELLISKWNTAQAKAQQAKGDDRKGQSSIGVQLQEDVQFPCPFDDENFVLECN